MKETRLPTKNEEKLRAIKKQMNTQVVMYSEEWFALKEKWQKLYQEIEKARRQNEERKNSE